MRVSFYFGVVLYFYLRFLFSVVKWISRFRQLPRGRSRWRIIWFQLDAIGWQSVIGDDATLRDDALTAMAIMIERTRMRPNETKLSDR